MYTIIKVINADKVYKYHFFFFYFDEKESHFFSVKADMTFSSTSVSHFFDMQGHYWYNTVCCYSITWSSQILYCSVPTSSFCKLWKWIKITKKSGKNNCFKQSFNKIKESSNFRSKVCKDISVQASWSCLFQYLRCVSFLFALFLAFFICGKQLHLRAEGKSVALNFVIVIM